MPRINVRLDDVESGFATFPKGSYRVEIQESSKLAIAKASGEGKIQWVGKCLEGELEGKLISWNTSLQPQALWNLKAMLEVVGLMWEEDGFELEDAFHRILIIDTEPYHYAEDPPDVMRNQVSGYRKVAA